jgi:hypothetical protein
MMRGWRPLIKCRSVLELDHRCCSKGKTEKEDDDDLTNAVPQALLRLTLIWDQGDLRHHAPRNALPPMTTVLFAGGSCLRTSIAGRTLDSYSLPGDRPGLAWLEQANSLSHFKDGALGRTPPNAGRTPVSLRGASQVTGSTVLSRRCRPALGQAHLCSCR